MGQTGRLALLALVCGLASAQGVYTAGNFKYSIESQTCTRLSGWVADTTRLNQIVNITLVSRSWPSSPYDAISSTVLLNTTASLPNPASAAIMRDNGLHGFEVAVPSSHHDGVYRGFVLELRLGTELAGLSFPMTCGHPPNFTGSVDRMTCDSIVGWAADRNRLNQPVSVDVIAGSDVLGTFVANGLRTDVGAALGDNGLHGFNIPMPAALRNGTQRVVQIRFRDTGITLSGGERRSIQCAPPPVSEAYVGYVDHKGCDGFHGWAANLGRLNEPISVQLFANGVLSRVVANKPRQDVGAYLGDNGLHGFEIPIPPYYLDGVPRTYTVRFDSTSRPLANGTGTVQCGGNTPTSPAPPRYSGYLDYAGCDVIQGWAIDMNQTDQPVMVTLSEGSNLVSTVIADKHRADLAAALQTSGRHAFITLTPDFLKDGKPHQLHARFGITALALNSSPRTVQCAATGPPQNMWAGWVDQTGCEWISGWAADRLRSNTSISVDIYANSNLMTTIWADQVRGDVGAHLGDNGAHGFAWRAPASLRNGQPQIITVRPSGSTTVLGGPQRFQCPPVP
jgi:hypothetical protein